MTKKEAQKLIADAVRDSVMDLLVTKRKDDETIPPGFIDHANAMGVFTVNDMTLIFQDELKKQLGDY